jgi:cell division protein ZapA (FtsZ GTPase activity inhibitor)
MATKVQLPGHFDQLELTEEQKDQMSRAARTYDAKIAELKQRMDAARRVRVGTAGVIVGLANAIKRLANQRQQALEDLLTDEQRDKLRQLRAGA